MARTTRRRFLEAGLAVPAALVARPVLRWGPQGLGQFVQSTPACRDDEHPTPAETEGPYFRPHSPERASLIEPGVEGTKLVLSGTVAGVTCGFVAHALLDFWQADARGAYDGVGFRLRGHQFTAADGRYRLETIVPGPDDDRTRHLHVRVQAPGKAVLTTQLFFPDEPLNARDALFRAELVIKIADGKDGKTGTFKFILNI
jgi:protocatechuate 3,4-dioxygenase beta subunit